MEDQVPTPIDPKLSVAVHRGLLTALIIMVAMSLLLQLPSLYTWWLAHP